MDRITVRISKSLANRLRDNYRASGKTHSEVVRAALESYLGEGSVNRSAFDAASAAGLIGCARGFPRDLSTNRRYPYLNGQKRPSGAKARVIVGAMWHG